MDGEIKMTVPRRYRRGIQRPLSVKRGELREGSKMLPRGMIEKIPMPGAASLEQAGIDFRPDGTVAQRYYREKHERVRQASPELEVAGVAIISDSSAAVRRDHHQLENVTVELKQMHQLHTQIQGLHHALAKQGTTFNADQRKSAHDYSLTLSQSINEFDRVTKKMKLRAQEKLQLTAKRLEEGNIGAAIGELVKSRDYILTRVNYLRRQHAYLRRRKELTVGAREVERKKQIARMDFVQEKMDAISNFERFNVADRSRVISDLGRLQKNVGRRFDEATAKRWQALLGEAIELLEQGKHLEAREVLEKFEHRLIYRFAKAYTLTPEMMRHLRRIENPLYLLKIVRTQVRLLGDNVVYWGERARPDQLQNMAKYLASVNNLLAQTEFGITQKRISQIPPLIQKRDFAGAKAALKAVLVKAA